MKKIIYSGFILLVLLTSAGCEKWIDVNRNPNGPDLISPNLYLAPMLYYTVQADQWDGRYVGKYIQNWAHITDRETWDVMGYAAPPSDAGGETWKLTYISLGRNLEDMMRDSEAQERWDMLGVGYVLKAWGFQKATDMHGEIIVKQIGQDRPTFDYDSQEYAYEEIRRLLDLAIVNLQRTDGIVSKSYLAKGDIIYNGTREQWLKLAYGLMALNLSHLTNKATYDGAKVIEYVDKSFTGNVDNALYTFSGGQSALSNFYGQRRGNMNSFRQTDFLVGLLDGTAFGGAVDPRLSRMLWPSVSGIYKGLQSTYALTTIALADRPPTFFNTTGNVAESSSGRYIFDDVAKVPLMTYSQLQFVKAEAAHRIGDKNLALDAYKKGVEAHIDFVNTTNARVPTGTASQITATEKTAYMTNVNIVPASSADLTLSHILCQKYIAQFGWGFLETWTDLRRFHYTDMDPQSTTTQVFRNFAPPEVSRLAADNIGKVVYRMRPRYASEYVWNRAALEGIGGLLLDFQTKPTWIVNP